MNYRGSNKFGVLPRRTVIANQPHMLAYINPQEEMLLRQMGGAGEPVGSMGIPAYYFGYGGQEKPDENFGYDAPGYGGGGGNQGVSVNAYNDAISRANQPLGIDYNQDARNIDLATIDAYNASFTPVNDPSEIATPAISSPVSDGGFLGVSDGGSGYVSVDAMADTTPDVGFVPDNYTPDLGGYIGAIDDDGLPNVDVNEGDFIDNPYPIEMGGDGEGEPPANGGEPPVNQPEPEIDTAEYFNLYRSTQPSSWMGNSIWSNYGEGPDFNVDVYQEADGSLRFRENGELVPEEYLKYIKYARRTEMDAPGEEDVA